MTTKKETCFAVAWPMNAEEYLDTLRGLNQRLWEQVLDTVSENISETIPNNDEGEKYYYTSFDQNGNVVFELSTECSQ